VLLVLGLSVVAWLIWRSGAAVVWRLLIDLRWRFAAVTALYAMYLATRALALWRVVPTSLRYGDVFRIRLLGDTIENLTFTGPFVAEPTKGWLLTRSGLPTHEAFAAIATEYLLYDVVTGGLSAVAMVTLIALGVLPPVVRPIAFMLLGITGAFLTAFTYAALSGVGVIVPLISLSAPIIGRRRATIAARKFGRVERVLLHFLRYRRRALAEVVAIEAISQVLMTLEIYVVLTALVGIPRWWYPPVIEGAVKYVGLAFAFVPGQLGAAEGVYAFVTKVLGLTTTVGLTLALVRRLRGLLVAGIGVTALTLSTPRGTRRAETAAGHDGFPSQSA
jgi:Lysylphosphatidylglycerol synthase TM region